MSIQKMLSGFINGFESSSESSLQSDLDWYEVENIRLEDSKSEEQTLHINPDY